MDVMVTGAGAVTALGTGAGALLERWSAGEHGLGAGAGACDAFDPAEFLSRREVRRSDRFTQLAPAAAHEGIEGAGWGGGEGRPRTASGGGTARAGSSSFASQFEVFRRDGPDAISPVAVPLLMGNAAAAGVALRYRLGGRSGATDSGADAIAAGVRMIRSGAADSAIVGGSDTPLTPFVRHAFERSGATSPSGTCRPFDARHDGLVLGEGAAVLVLESERFARARSAPVLGRVAGVGAA